MNISHMTTFIKIIKQRKIDARYIIQINIGTPTKNVRRKKPCPTRKRGVYVKNQLYNNLITFKHIQKVRMYPWRRHTGWLIKNHDMRRVI